LASTTASRDGGTSVVPLDALGQVRRPVRALDADQPQRRVSLVQRAQQLTASGADVDDGAQAGVLHQAVQRDGEGGGGVHGRPEVRGGPGAADEEAVRSVQGGVDRLSPWAPPRHPWTTAATVARSGARLLNRSAAQSLGSVPAS
jgi:hypothetical protein